MDAIASAALPKIGSFSSQDLANTSWAFASCGVSHGPLMDAIAASARRKISQCDLRALPPEDLHLLALDLTALAWAFAFVSQLAAAVRAGVLDALASAGREVDRRVAGAAEPRGRLAAAGRAPLLLGQYDGYVSAHEAAVAGIPNATVQRSGTAAGTSIGDPPAVVLDRPGMAVVFKPTGWEVDSTGGGVDRMLLSGFLQGIFPEEHFSLVHSLDFGYGLLHRLDVPSSGLVLAATSFEGLYVLRGQLNTYRLAREYITICHSLAPPTLEIDARVDATSTRVLRSAVGDTGRPASSRLRTPAHLQRRSGLGSSEGRTACVVAVRIRTGRRHQIRAHTRHAGHPTVADSWYCPEACTLRAD
mmetsp:Transcript_41601/g.129421  ORF Transcript_41601/g.129421 Transcript_41601/m.129421 type:complete len:360 (-) Transcript_41601:53-1132(-)